MKQAAARRVRVILLGTAVAIACATGLPLVAGAVGLSSPVGSCSPVGANSPIAICGITATNIPTGAPQTGAGGASHQTDGSLVAGGGLALAGAIAAMGLAMGRRPSRQAPKD